MSDEIFFVAGSVAAVAAILVLRFSWARPRRSPALNGLGWLLLVFSLFAGAATAGAWGISVMALWAMGAAFAILAIAAWQSPPARRKPSSRRAGMLPEGDEPLRIGGRIVTFLLIVVAAMISSIALAITTRWLALLMGASEGNANVLALFAAPLAWTILAFLVLMTESRRRQLAIIALPLISAIPAFVMGSSL
ncbi:hypothetical protein [Sphingorhabdus sp. SMR4y]|uniref:hypothetical protein n=1 Tax=Sphingorhabdus sp. SMR4y TaxID=2584094 RepID=UPI000B5C4AAC|nr:hypothetical protein [Sphingorhabdus sp. SMR4y]ASK87936.1 hypothetical protein SPHFLASMR4Y_01170 [Sphingorhabdus sp. SMR4y]